MNVRLARGLWDGGLAAAVAKALVEVGGAAGCTGSCEGKGLAWGTGGCGCCEGLCCSKTGETAKGLGTAWAYCKRRIMRGEPRAMEPTSGLAICGQKLMATACWRVAMAEVT